MANHSKNYRRFVLLILTLVYALNFIDRQILVILQESIKADMHLSDTQLGLLSGFAFAMFYVSAGIPIARWADVANRKNIISIAIATWSGMTALCGLAQNYFHLLMARIGVGIGEAGAVPPSHSIISDYYPSESRGSALSIHSSGAYIGLLVGFLLGGWINESFGWRTAFMVVGLPGLIVSLLVYYLVREPIRGLSDIHQNPNGDTTLKETLQCLRQLRCFRWLALASGFSAFVNYGIGNFLPSFLMRSHGFDSTEAGVSLALIAGIGGAAGTFLGGFLADALGRRDLRWYLWVPGIPAGVSVTLMLSGLFADDSTIALAFLFIGIMLGALYIGPVFAITHTLLKPDMRALASAVLVFVYNLLGLGLGPLFAGLISDSLEPSLGTESLRYALAMISGAGLLSMAGFLIAASRLKADISNPKLPQTPADNLTSTG